MIIHKLYLEEGLTKNTDNFSPKRNLVHSSDNAKGKSTYLRLLFWALGYQIPSMDKMDFQSIHSQLHLEIKEKKFIISRNGLVLICDLIQGQKNMRTTYLLPSEHTAFLHYLFDYDKMPVLENLLGIIYLDQEKGWTLLNRGKVIGRICFSIEELLAGLNEVDIGILVAETKKTQLDKNKYKVLLQLRELKEAIYEAQGEVIISDKEKEFMQKIAYHNQKLATLRKEIREIDKAIENNTSFFNYIEDLSLEVSDGSVTIPVKRGTLLNANNCTEFLKARKGLLTVEFEALKRTEKELLFALEQEELQNSQIAFYDVGTNDSILNKQLSTITIDPERVEQQLLESKKEHREANKKLKAAVRANNDYIQKIFDYVEQYANTLGIGTHIKKDIDYIFTNKLSNLSGSILQRMVFAFKLAFLKVIEEDMGIKLPFVLDSPKGKELDDANAKKMEALIKKELANNQVIIGSIFEFENENKIILTQRAIEGRTEKEIGEN